MFLDGEDVFRPHGPLLRQWMKVLQLGTLWPVFVTPDRPVEPSPEFHEPISTGLPHFFASSFMGLLLLSLLVMLWIAQQLVAGGTRSIGRRLGWNTAGRKAVRGAPSPPVRQGTIIGQCKSRSY